MLQTSCPLSVIINNYNHERFLPRAVESALAYAPPQTQVLVVDDGSTDASLQTLERFGSRISVLALANGGQLRACQAALRAARGRYVYFLDADDEMGPEFGTEIAPHLDGRALKIQFQLQAIDAEGRSLPSRFPLFPADYTESDMRADVAAWGQYVAPPTSGNVFRRDFLEEAWESPVDYETAVDGIALFLAPFRGPVVSIDRALANYRLHGANLHQQHVLDAARFQKEADRLRARLVHLEALTGAQPFSAGRPPGLLLENELYAAVASGAPVRAKVLGYLRALWRSRQRLKVKLAVSVWGAALGLAPTRARATLARWRLSPLNRPRWVNRWVARVRG